MQKLTQYLGLVGILLTTSLFGQNVAPVFTSTPTTEITIDIPYDYFPEATDADNDPLTYSAPLLPSWLTMADFEGYVEQTGENSLFNGIDIGYGSRIVLVDIDYDGDMDLFATNSAVFYFRNIGSVNEPVFELQEGASNPLNQVDIGASSLTLAFVDIDYDHDKDVFIGDGDGEISYFQNVGTRFAASYMQRTGSLNPLDGVDVGSSARPSFVDIDGDGDQDAVIGEHWGWLNYLENVGTRNSPDYFFHQYEDSPFDDYIVGHSATFVDWDEDGDFDYISGNNNGTFGLYENRGTATSPNFTWYDEESILTPLDIGDGALPGVTDIDNDGDLDLFTGVSDGRILQFMNENGPRIQGIPSFDDVGTNDVSISVSDGVIAVSQDFTISVYNSTQPVALPQHISTLENQEVSITLSGTDPDDDPLSFSIVSSPENGTLVGDPPNITYQPNLDWWGNDSLSFVAHDGFLDSEPATVSITVRVNTPPTFTSTPTSEALRGQLYYYGATAIDSEGDVATILGTTLPDWLSLASHLEFTEQDDDNILDNIDIGSQSTPAFVDIDNDGDEDLFIGEQSGNVNYYQNTGSGVDRDFVIQLGANNPLNIDVGSSSAPIFLDLEGDDDFDAFVGSSDGTIKYFKNIGTPTTPEFIQMYGAANPLNLVDVGNYSKPALGELDNDGNPDIIIANHLGEISYWRYTGTTAVPHFNETTGVHNPFYNLSIDAYASLAMHDIDSDGDLDLISTNSEGELTVFERNAITYVEMEPNPLSEVVGTSLSPTIVDLDKDGNTDIVLGGDSGSLRFIKSYCGTAVAGIPWEGDLGANQVTLTVSDGAAETIQSFQIEVQDNPTPPVVSNQMGRIHENTSIEFTLHAFDPEDEPLTYSIVDYPSNGSLDEGLPSVIYTPNSDWAGTDSFTFNANDGSSTSETGVVTIHVDHNDPPSFSSIPVTTGSEQYEYLYEISASDPDADQLRYSSTQLPEWLTLVQNQLYERQLDTDNILNGINPGSSLTPRFVDIDADGDMDLFIGTHQDGIAYYQNNGTTQNPDYTLLTGNANPADVVSGGFSYKLAFVDIDNDGDYELFVGQRDRTVRFFKNEGTIYSPSFIEQFGEENPLTSAPLVYYPLPSFVDIDSDGDQDVFIGSSGGSIHYLQNVGTQVNAEFTLQSGENNPLNGNPGENGSLAFYDLDVDGDLDALCGNSSGTIKYYKNIGSSTSPILSMQSGVNNPFNGIDLGSSSSPAIMDSDLDGDGDVFVGTMNGDIKHFRNETTSLLMGVPLEQHGGDNEVELTASDGIHVVSQSFVIVVSDSTFPVVRDMEVETVRNVPVSFTLTGMDIGGDSLSHEILTTPSSGDISGSAPYLTYTPAPDWLGTTSFTYRISDGFSTSSIATVTISVVLNSPPYYPDVPIQPALEDEPYSFVITAGDADGNDLIFSASDLPEWVSNASYHGFEEQLGQANPFSGVSLERSKINFVDIDGDGDMDAFLSDISNLILFYKNVGSMEVPIFEEQVDDLNPLNLAVDREEWALDFGDLDADGDQDAVLGYSSGRLLYYKNTGTLFSPVFDLQPNDMNPFYSLNFGYDSTPALVDIDGDGDLDLFGGSTYADISYAQNIGTHQIPIFILRTYGDNPLDIDAGQSSYIDFIDIDRDGDMDAFLGEYAGDIEYYKNIGNSHIPDFALQGSADNPLNLDVGYYSTPALVDINQDGYPDVFIGDGEGAINYYKNSHGLLLSGTPLESDIGDYPVLLGVYDGENSVEQTLILSVLNTNDAPTVEDVIAETYEDTPLVLNFNGSDSDGDSLVYEVVDTPEFGECQDGVYIPAANWSGIDAFTYLATDGVAESYEANMIVVVYPVNDPPAPFMLNELNDIVFTTENILSDSIAFSWEESSDVEESELSYHLQTTLTFLGDSDSIVEIIDTSLVGTRFEFMSFQNLATRMFGQAALIARLEWNVSASDSVTEVPSTNGPNILTIDASTVSIEDLQIPENVMLYQNYPNPFNPTTTIRYELPEQSNVSLIIYDLNGKIVRTIESGSKSMGRYKYIWNGLDESGMQLSTGVYLTRLQAGSYTKTIKMLYIK